MENAELHADVQSGWRRRGNCNPVSTPGVAYNYSASCGPFPSIHCRSLGPRRRIGAGVLLTIQLGLGSLIALHLSEYF